MELVNYIFYILTFGSTTLTEFNQLSTAYGLFYLAVHAGIWYAMLKFWGNIIWTIQNAKGGF